MRCLKTSLRALNLAESAGIGATATFMPLFANLLTSSYILVGSIVAGYGLAQALSYAYFAKMYDSRGASHRLFLIRLGYLLCAAAFFAHLLAFDGLSLFAIRVFAGAATGVYACALMAKTYEATCQKVALAGIISFGSLGWFAGTIDAALSAAVFIAYFATQSYFQVFPIQVMLGISWSTLYMGSLLFLLGRNKEKASSSALLESTISVGAIVGPLVGGFVAEMFDIRSVLLFAFFVTLGSFAMSRALKKETMAEAPRSGIDPEKSF